MKICVAQTNPVKGDIEYNIRNHKKWIDLAVSHGAKLIIFPELSLTGYEPTLAGDLAILSTDKRFDVFDDLSIAGGITIGVGVPIKTDTGICISMILFQPGGTRRIYSKKYLHPDEIDFFTSGHNFSILKVDEESIALAICYEISIPEHAEQASTSGATIYIASVAKFASGIDRALQTLSDIAKKYDMIVLMANCIGVADGQRCAGRPSAWSVNGSDIGQLNDAEEGILLLDTETGKTANLYANLAYEQWTGTA